MSGHKIAAGNPVTLQSAVDLLEAGGNAYDAAVGAVFTSMTAEFTLTGPCGGGALLAVPCDKEPILFDFFVDSPPPQPNTPLDFFDASVDFGSAQQIFHIGKGSVAIPGNVAGLFHVHRRLGILPLNIVLEPAICAAHQGVIVDAAQAYIFKILKPIYCHYSAGIDFFCRGGHYTRENDLFSNPAFADFLDSCIKNGAGFLYTGEGANAIVDLQKDGGWIKAEHLRKYRVFERKPVQTQIGDYEYFSNPTPSIGGTLIVFLLKYLQQKWGSLDNISPDQLAQAMAMTSMVRKTVHTDPDNEHQLDAILTDPAFLDDINLEKGAMGEPDPFARGETTHVSILDKYGNAASVTTTNGEGCGYFLPELGIMMNNMLGEEDINPLGFHAWNRQRRLPTMISPSVILKEGKPALVIGSGGSNRIRSAIVQVILHSLFQQMDLHSAIHAPRLHVEGNVVHTEPGIDIINKANSEVHPWDELNLFFGGVNAVTPSSAAGDCRRGGVGRVIQ